MVVMSPRTHPNSPTKKPFSPLACTQKSSQLICFEDRLQPNCRPLFPIFVWNYILGVWITDSEFYRRLFNDRFPVLLRHYGPFCSLFIFRSSLDCKLLTFSILTPHWLSYPGKADRDAPEKKSLSGLLDR